MESNTIHLPVRQYTIYILGFLLASASVHAQKTIIINDSLVVNADRLEVNMGSLWMGKIKKFSFGEYTMISSKVGATIERSKSNLFETKTESKSSKKFSFVLNNSRTDTASVNAGIHSTMVHTVRKIAVINGWSIGDDDLTESNNFTSMIIINSDTTDIWVLFIGGTNHNGVGNYQSYLTNGKRKVLLTLASSNKMIQHTSVLNAVGYEFFENEKSLCALQYFGGIGKQTNIIWLHNGLDAKMKLILSAAMTVVLLVSSPMSPIH